MVAVRERNAGGGRCALRRTDAGHGVAGNAGGHQRLRFFAAPAKDVRVAALEAHQRFTLFGQPHHQINDAFLRQGVVAALLADIDQLCALRHMRQHIVGDQVVVQHRAGAGQHAGGLEREQLGVARAGAHQRHPAPLRGGHHRARDRVGAGAGGGRKVACHGETPEFLGTCGAFGAGARCFSLIVKTARSSVLDAHQGQVAVLRQRCSL